MEEGPNNNYSEPMQLDSIAQLQVGCKLPVLKIMPNEEDYRPAELLAIKPPTNETSEYEFYVHYVHFNKRLDEWVTEDKLDLTQVRFMIEKKDGKKKVTGKMSKKRNKKGGDVFIAENAEELDQDLQAIQQKKMQIILDTHEDGAETPETPEPNRIKSLEEERESLRHGGSMTTRPEEIHRVKNISKIVMGKHQMETWYFSPYPQEYTLTDIVYICEFCLMYFHDRFRMDRHRQKCTLFHPPGNEIYRNGKISFFEIDGHKQRLYCRNLCLLSKLFLDHKTLYYDVNPFLFYIMTQNDEYGCHIVGYFSKEKESADSYNVACILTLPNHQRKGYGRLLIQFSYELSKLEGKLGSPEKPLSDLGLLSYRSYWSEIVLDHLFQTQSEEFIIDELSQQTSMTHDDILHTLQALDLVRYYNGQFVVVLNDRHRQQYQKFQKKKKISIDPSKLDWRPPQFSAAQLRYV